MKKYLSPQLLFWQTAVVLLVSCQKYEPAVHPIPQPSTTVAAAHAWFEDNFSSRSGRTDQGTSQPVPLWESAETVTLMNGKAAVAVPLQKQEKDPGTGSLTRLLLSQDQNDWQAQVMTLISDSAYFYANGETINMENFSGILTLRDWQENFLRGVGFQNGQVISELSESNTSARGEGGCQLVTVAFYTKVCVGGSCTTTLDYEINYIECTAGGGGGGLPIPEGPIGGGGGTPPSGQPIPFTFLKPRIHYTIPGQEKEPIDLTKYLDCFGTNTNDASYQLTVYVDEPISGSGATKFGFDVGHAFVGLKKTWADGTTTEQVFGFYPAEYSTGWVGSKFSDNGSSPYSVSVTFPVTAQQFTDASNAARYMTSEMYNVVSQNCTDVVFYIFDATGIALPKNQSSFPFGGGSGHSPGQLGLDFRNQAAIYPVNTAAGNAPGSKGPC